MTSSEGNSREGRRFRGRRWLIASALILVFAAAADLLGWNIRGWLSDLWDTMTAVSPASLAAAIVMMTVQTTATAYGWYAILRYAYPSATRWRDILAGYAVSVALNSILPANLGTLVMLILFSVVVGSATFAGVLGGYAVQKIFFTLAGAFVYLYLFLSVEGSFDIKFEFVHERPFATILLLASGAYLIFVVSRRIWPRIVHWWGQAKEGGAILGRPARFAGQVVLPSFIGWAAMLASTAILLDAYSIPVTFETVMRVVGGNSVANVTSVTPGGAGVTQAFNVASLRGITSSSTATAYSVASQLLHTAWNIVFAIVLMVWAWGWTGGKQLVQDSLDDARRRQAEEKDKRRARREKVGEGVAS